jgi:hypothetical protein
LATNFELDNDSLGGGHPSLDQMAKSNIKSDVAIQASFAGSVTFVHLLTGPSWCETKANGLQRIYYAGLPEGGCAVEH